MIFGKVGRLGHGKTMRAVVEALDLAQRRSAVLASNILLRTPPEVPFVALPMDAFSSTLGALLDYLNDCEACQDVEVVTVVEERPSLVIELGDAGFDVDAPRRAQVRHGGPGCKRRGLVVLVDEVDTIWDAHEWQDMSKLDRFRIKQSRKLGCDLIWTAQFVDQVEKSIRNITEEVELLRAVPGPSLDRRERGKRPWLLVGQYFRPGAVRELTTTVDKDRRMRREIHRYRREHEELYNTDELVRPPDHEPRRSRRSAKSYTPPSSLVADGEPGGAEPVASTTAERHGPLGPSSTPPRYQPRAEPGPGRSWSRELGAVQGGVAPGAAPVAGQPGSDSRSTPG